MTLNNLNLDLFNVNVYTKFRLILFILCQDIEQNQILTSIKGCKSVANMRKIRLYNSNIDLNNDNVHTQFGYILSIGSQYIEQKRNSDINKGL